MNSNTQICSFCSKCFKRKAYYEKHVMMCERLQESKKINYDKEIDDLLESQDYKLLLMNLIKSQNKLQKQVNELMEQNNYYRKKIDIIPWLNDNCKQIENIDSKLNDFTINSDELNYIFENTLIDGFVHIFENYFLESNCPLKCFDVKKNEFIVYTDKWDYCNLDTFTFIVNTIHKKILDAFYQWKENNKHKLQNEQFSLLYNQYSQKVLQNDIRHFILKIKPKLYSCLRQEFSQTYQFDYL